MRRLSVLVALVAMIALAGGALAVPPSTAPGQNKLQCFDGTTDGGFGGVCTLPTKGAKGPATLDLSGDVTGGANYAGVYTLESTIYSSALSSLTQLSYQYSGTVVPTAGNLSYNIPIDSDANGTTDFYLFVDAAQDGLHCPGVGGLVDIINDPNCAMWEGGVTPRANWAAVLAANPLAQIANDQFAFIVAERTDANPPAIWMVNNVKFGKGGK